MIDNYYEEGTYLVEIYAWKVVDDGRKGSTGSDILF